MLVLEEEQPHERDVVGQFLHSDDICKSHLGALRGFELDLMKVVDLSLDIQVYPTLAQVIILQEGLTYAQTFRRWLRVPLPILEERLVASAFKAPVVVKQTTFLALDISAEELVVSLEMRGQRFKDIALLVLEVL